MATPKISVVVPIYKVEECLAWCLDSLLAQDVPDWEGVLVNDGLAGWLARYCGCLLRKGRAL